MPECPVHGFFPAALRVSDHPDEQPLRPAATRKGVSTEYPIVKIGAQYWMGKELHATTYRDGAPLKKQSDLGTDKAGYYKPGKKHVSNTQTKPSKVSFFFRCCFKKSTLRKFRLGF